MRSSTDSVESTSPTEAGAADLSQFRTIYAKADGFCKEVQSFASEAGIPAMNELRYAGHHMIVAVDDAGRVSDHDHLVRAINHAKRACYEAGEAGVLIALDRIDTFKTDYKTISVTGVLKNYVDILQAAESAKKRVVLGRDHPNDGASDHADYMEHFRGLVPHCAALDIAREELNKVLADQSRTTRRWVIGVCLTVAFGLTTASIGIYNATHKGGSISPASAAEMPQKGKAL